VPGVGTACRKRALDLLARREHSRLELATKLGARGHDDAAIAAVLSQLEQEGLLSNRRFAQSFIRARVAKGQGPVRIRLELAQRGIEEGRDILGDADIDWDRLARAVRVKRFGPELPADYQERARRARFLQYRGFELTQISQALDFAAE
jgi:regulatory protein